METTLKRYLTLPVITPRGNGVLRHRSPSRQGTRMSIASSLTSRQKTMSPSKMADTDKKTRKSKVDELYKMSYPCHKNNCCYCAYSQCLGPVKIYITQYTPTGKQRDQYRGHNKGSDTAAGLDGRMSSSARNSVMARKVPDIKSTAGARKSFRGQ